MEGKNNKGEECSEKSRRKGKWEREGCLPKDWKVERKGGNKGNS